MDSKKFVAADLISVVKTCSHSRCAGSLLSTSKAIEEFQICKISASHPVRTMSFCTNARIGRRMAAPLTLSTVNRVHDLPGMLFSDAVDTGTVSVTAASGSKLIAKRSPSRHHQCDRRMGNVLYAGVSWPCPVQRTATPQPRLPHRRRVHWNAGHRRRGRHFRTPASRREPDDAPLNTPNSRDVEIGRVDVGAGGLDELRL